MSDPVRSSTRAPVARPAGGNGPARPPAGGVDLRPRFSELLRQRKTADPLVDGGLSFGDSALDPVDLSPDHEAEPQEDQTPESPAPDLPPPAPDLSPGAAEAEPGEAVHASQAQATAPLSAADRQQIDRMATVVARFCNDRAVSDSEGWQVQIELRPEVLPSTTLTLSVSPLWLCLRFAIHDDRSRQLIMTHRQALADQLEEALVRRREISIGFD